MPLKVKGPVPVDETSTYCGLDEDPSFVSTPWNKLFVLKLAEAATPMPVIETDCVPLSRPSVVSVKVAVRVPELSGLNVMQYCALLPERIESPAFLPMLEIV